MVYGQVRQRESVCTLALVSLSQNGGELTTPNLASAWPEDWARFYRCPYSRILSLAGAPLK